MTIPDTQRALAPCPCGKTPTALHIVDYGQGGTWADCMGNCCKDWKIEFRTGYNELQSPECIALAAEAWNKAPRSTAAATPLDELLDALGDLVGRKQERAELVVSKYPPFAVAPHQQGSEAAGTEDDK